MNDKAVVLIVEDESVIRNFLAAKLEASGYRTLSVSAGKDALSMAASHCPDLILLDLGLPDIDGLEVLTAIREWSGVPIVIVSARQQEEGIVEALDKGADDYIIKPFNNSIFMARMRTALRKNSLDKRNSACRPLSFNGGSLCIDDQKRQVSVNGGLVHLTPIEYKTLALLAKNSGSVITYKTFLRELWGPYIEDNQVLRVNMANLRRKIERNSADPEIIFTEVGVGYRMIESDESVS